MKNFRFLFVGLFMLLAVTANAQLRWGLKAGFNASTLNGLENIYGDGDYSKNYHAGFHAGAVMQFMFTPSFGIETGLYYSMLGYKDEYKDSQAEPPYEETRTSTSNPSYLQLPIAFLYKFDLGSGLSLYPSAGIYLGCGIAGKTKIEETMTGRPDSKEEYDYFGKFKVNGTEKEIYNRFDAGLTFGLNLEYNKIVFGVGYDLGLAKVNKEKLTKGGKRASDLKNENIKASIGYFF